MLERGASVGRIVTRVSISNPLDPSHEIAFDALVDTGSAYLVLPEAWRERKVVFPTGGEIRLPPPSRADIEAEGVELVEERDQTLLMDNTVLVSGQVQRVTEFEQGFPIHYGRSAADYTEVPKALERFSEAARAAGLSTRVPAPGEWFMI